MSPIKEAGGRSYSISSFFSFLFFLFSIFISFRLAPVVLHHLFLGPNLFPFSRPAEHLVDVIAQCVVGVAANVNIYLVPPVYSKHK